MLCRVTGSVRIVMTKTLRFLVDYRYPMRYRRLKKYLGREPCSILEIGCGDGLFLLFLERKLKGRCRLVGLNLDVKNVEIDRDSNIELIQGSIDDIESNDQFDMVIMYDVIENGS